MNETDPFDDAFVDSLRQMSAGVPTETKFRLLYECGMAAAESRQQARQGKRMARISLALLLAVAGGFFLNRLVADSNDSSGLGPGQVQVAKGQTTHDATSQNRSHELSRDIISQNKSLKVVMPLNQVLALLEQAPNHEADVRSIDLSVTRESPLSTMSIFEAME